MNYTELQAQYPKLNIQELDLTEVDGLKGLCLDDNIAIEKKLSQNEKNCILAEELGHYHTSFGNILNQTIISNRKQEHIARLWAYDKLIGLPGIIQGYKMHCQSLYELANFFDVTESFLKEALECYRAKYGCYTEIDGYVIMFEPHLSVVEKL